MELIFIFHILILILYLTIIGYICNHIDYNTSLLLFTSFTITYIATYTIYKLSKMAYIKINIHDLILTSFLLIIGFLACNVFANVYYYSSVNMKICSIIFGIIGVMFNIKKFCVLLKNMEEYKPLI